MMLLWFVLLHTCLSTCVVEHELYGGYCKISPAVFILVPQVHRMDMQHMTSQLCKVVLQDLELGLGQGLGIEQWLGHDYCLDKGSG